MYGRGVFARAPEARLGFPAGCGFGFMGGGLSAVGVICLFIFPLA
jgi:hypothetical protein